MRARVGRHLTRGTVLRTMPHPPPRGRRGRSGGRGEGRADAALGRL